MWSPKPTIQFSRIQSARALLALDCALSRFDPDPFAEPAPGSESLSSPLIAQGEGDIDTSGCYSSQPGIAFVHHMNVGDKLDGEDHGCYFQLESDTLKAPEIAPLEEQVLSSVERETSTLMLQQRITVENMKEGRTSKKHAANQFRPQLYYRRRKRRVWGSRRTVYSNLLSA